jgi:hypothetical protein
MAHRIAINRIPVAMERGMIARREHRSWREPANTHRDQMHAQDTQGLQGKANSQDGRRPVPPYAPAVRFKAHCRQSFRPSNHSILAMGVG